MFQNIHNKIYDTPTTSAGLFTLTMLCKRFQQMIRDFAGRSVGSQEIQNVFRWTAKALICLCWAHIQSCRKCYDPVQIVLTNYENTPFQIY